MYGSVFDDGTNKIAAALREAYENNTPIIYRIEKYRKRKARKDTKPYTKDGRIAPGFNGGHDGTEKAPVGHAVGRFVREYNEARGSMSIGDVEKKYRIFETAVAAVSLDGGKTWIETIAKSALLTTRGMRGFSRVTSLRATCSRT